MKLGRDKGCLHMLKQYIVSRVSGSTLECADRFYQARGGVKVFYCVVEVWKHLSTVIKILLHRYVFIYHMDMVVTTRCSLRCRDCSNLMQYYRTPEHVDLDVLLSSIRSLLEVTDRIGTLTLLGGEPLLYPELPELIRYLLRQKKIDKIRIITNGTLMIKDRKLLELMKHPKMYVYISNYGKLSRRKDELIKLFKEEKIRCFVFAEEVTWVDCGNLDCRKRSREDLAEQYTKCGSDCLSLLRGELHHCPRSAHGTDLGIIPRQESDLFSVLKVYKSRRMKRKILLDFVNRKTDFVAACDHCDKGTDKLPQIPAAVQMGRNNTKEE